MNLRSLTATKTLLPSFKFADNKLIAYGYYMASKSDLPSSKKLVWPVIQILKNTSGTAQKSAIDSQIVSSLMLSPELVAIRHDSSRAEYQYRVAWALSYGKKAGYFENPARNQWVLTEKGRQVISPAEITL